MRAQLTLSLARQNIFAMCSIGQNSHNQSIKGDVKVHLDISDKELSRIKSSPKLANEARNATRRIKSVLDLTQGIIWETGLEGYDYSVTGSCFPLRYKNSLYIVTALHVLRNLCREPKDMMYIVGSDKRNAFSYDLFIFGNEQLGKKNDFCLSRVTNPELMGALKFGSIFDLEKDLLSISADSLHDLYIRGYPEELKGNFVDYDSGKISTQAYMTNGFERIRQIDEPGCSCIKMKTPVDLKFNNNPNGMSGSPVYGINKALKPGICGIMIGYNKFTDEYLIINASSILDSLKIFAM
jgi:hypothetical protein